jgi:hypothetical protein
MKSYRRALARMDDADALRVEEVAAQLEDVHQQDPPRGFAGPPVGRRGRRPDGRGARA